MDPFEKIDKVLADYEHLLDRHRDEAVPVTAENLKIVMRRLAYDCEGNWGDTRLAHHKLPKLKIGYKVTRSEWYSCIHDYAIKSRGITVTIIHFDSPVKIDTGEEVVNFAAVPEHYHLPTAGKYFTYINIEAVKKIEPVILHNEKRKKNRAGLKAYR